MTILDDKVRKDHENPSVGLILCKDMNKAFVDYVIRDYDKSIASDLCSRIVPLDEVEYTLDRLLDFCGDDAVLGLFKDVCRHYFNIYPEMIAYQVNSYREIWDME